MIRNRKYMLIRAYMVAVGILVIALGVLYSMANIQISEGSALDEFAEKNNFRLKSEPSKRGNLYASGGDLLATTITVHNIYIDLAVIDDKLFESQLGALSDSLSAMFDKPASYFQEKLKTEKKREIAT